MIKKIFFIFLAVFLIKQPCSCEKIKRKILGVYNSQEKLRSDGHPLHKALEMPLNQYGFYTDYFDIDDKKNRLPQNIDDYHGLITWFRSHVMKKPDDYLNWLSLWTQKNKKLIILNDIGTEENSYKKSFFEKENKIFAYLGLEAQNAWVKFTHNVRYLTPNVYKPFLNFERNLLAGLPPFRIYKSIGKQENSWIQGKNPTQAFSSLLNINSNGAYAAGGYFFHQTSETNSNYWHINPFIFVKESLQGKIYPIPDTSTLMGKRIFYSQIDGDGMASLSELEKYKKDDLSTGHVLYDTFKQFSNLPFSVSFIAGDLDPQFYGNKTMQTLAKSISTLSNVEIGSHGYTHILDWYYYDSVASAEKEKKDFKSDDAFNAQNLIDGHHHHTNYKESMYDTPRSYMKGPFSLDQEIKGSVDYINNIISPKKVTLFQWSGASLPFELAIQKTRELGIVNINGGDPRLDNVQPSYFYVAPIGRPVGRERQIYASACNENHYTNLWTDGFFGLQNVIHTYENTEKPLRIKPLNLYFHFYSAEKLASFNALLKVLEYINNYEIIPIHTSRFASLAHSFYEVEFDQIGDQAWQVQNNGSLTTIRFDEATFLCCDFEKSKGVIGQKHYQGSLYVTLDEQAPQKIIYLKENSHFFGHAQANIPYLVESRYNISRATLTPSLIQCEAEGFGPLEMKWFLPEDGKYSIKIVNNNNVIYETTAQSSNFFLNIKVDNLKVSPLNLEIKRIFS
jgi:polysaccharide biosynthesis protein PelA